MENTGEEANADSDLIEFIGTKGYEKIIVTDDYDQTDDAEMYGLKIILVIRLFSK